MLAGASLASAIPGELVRQSPGYPWRAPAQIELESSYGARDSQSVVNVFQTRSGRIIVVGWLRSSLADEVPQKTGTLVDRRAETVAVQLPCNAAQLAGAYNAVGTSVAISAHVRHGMLDNIRLSGGRVFIAELRCGSATGAEAPYGHSVAQYRFGALGTLRHDQP